MKLKHGGERIILLMLIISSMLYILCFDNYSWRKKRMGCKGSKVNRIFHFLQFWGDVSKTGFGVCRNERKNKLEKGGGLTGCDPVESKCFRVEVLSSRKLLGGLEYLSYIASLYFRLG